MKKHMQKALRESLDRINHKFATRLLQNFKSTGEVDIDKSEAISIFVQELQAMYETGKEEGIEESRASIVKTMGKINHFVGLGNLLDDLDQLKLEIKKYYERTR